MLYPLFVLTILASVSFFNFHGIISIQVAKLLFYLDILLCAFWASRDGVSLRGVDYPKRTYVLLLGCILLSAVMATMFHPQGIFESLMGVLPFFFAYSFFLVLMKMDLPKEKIIHTYIVLCAISTVVYFCNLATAPNNIFGEPIINEDLSRGIVRLPVVFIEMFPLLVFYAINQWLIKPERKWLVIIGWGALMVFMSVTRQIIAATAVLGGWLFFRRISMVKKMAFVGAGLLVVVVVLPMIPVYKTMMELSEDQRDNNENTEDVRITAWRYYTYENQTNALTTVFGDGIPSYGNSLWGKMFDSETEDNGCYSADVGWAGFFWHFGAVATICLMVIFVKALRKPKPPQEQYLNYWIVYIMLTSVASGPILYFNFVSSITVVLYLVFKKEDGQLPDDMPKNDMPQDRPAPLLPKYPQLHR